jgi:meiotic recombination protein SPO11
LEVATSPAAVNNKNRKRVIVTLADDADVVLAKCRQLKETLRTKHKDDSDETKPSTIPQGIVEVDELSATEVLEGIEGIALQITQQGFSLDIPSRAASNQIYVKEWDRIVLGSKRTGRTFLNVRESRKSAITLRVMQLLHAVLVKRIHITKRDLFYTDVKLFVDQAESDGVLDDVATMIGCTRSNLHVVASDKGLVVGRIQFEEDGDPIDCTRMGVGGKAIPPYIDKIENIRSDAEFILLVEKEAAYMRMAVR